MPTIPAGLRILSRLLVLVGACGFPASAYGAELVTERLESLKLETGNFTPPQEDPGSIHLRDSAEVSGALAVGGTGIFSEGIPWTLPLGGVPMGSFTNMPGQSATAADAPAWWLAFGVTDTNPPCDYAAATQGQVKWSAHRAADMLDAAVPLVGGAGTAVSGLIAAFTSSSNTAAVTVGQLKHVAAPFWQRLAELGIAGEAPWEAGFGGDFAAANVGQVKFLFSFDLDLDSDGDGLPDGWEANHGLDPFDHIDAALDTDGDGLSNLQEYLHGTDPGNPDSDGDGMADGWEVRHGLAPTDPLDAAMDSDGDGLSNLAEFLRGTNPGAASVPVSAAALQLQIATPLREVLP